MSMYDQDEYEEQCYHISEYQPRGSMMGHGDEVGWVEPDSFMETVKRLLSESDTKYIISCPVANEDDGFGLNALNDLSVIAGLKIHR